MIGWLVDHSLRCFKVLSIETFLLEDHVDAGRRGHRSILKLLYYSLIQQQVYVVIHCYKLQSRV